MALQINKEIEKASERFIDAKPIDSYSSEKSLSKLVNSEKVIKNERNLHINVNSKKEEDQSPDNQKKSFMKSNTLNQFFSEPRNKLQKYGDYMADSYSINLSESTNKDLESIFANLAKFMIHIYNIEERELSDGIYEGN